MCSRVVVSLDDGTADLILVGGKGASLARLRAAGLPGFHVTTDAYRDFVARAGLQGEILAAVADVDAERPDTFEAASRRISELFARQHMPDATAEKIRTAYAALGADVPVAVRSSATAEDLPTCHSRVSRTRT